MRIRFLKPLAVAAIVLCAFVLRPAQATAITLDLAAIDMFTQLDSNDSSAITGVNKSTKNGNEFTKFTTIFDGTGSSYANVGRTNLGLDWSAYDTFELAIDNRNENIWEFQLFVVDANGTISNSALVALAPLSTGGALQTFAVDLSMLKRSDIQSVFLRVGANLPLPNSDRTAEYTIRPVPEPASLLMLSIGLGLLGSTALRKKTSKSV